jgi:predicted RNA binding protein YcfA (HicA-like mRNA interferase family)
VSTRQPVVTADALIRALKRSGFSVTRTKGSHFFLAHQDGRKTSVPVHGRVTLKPGTLSGILSDVHWSTDDLRRRL